MKQQGGGDLERGFANLDTHIRIVRGFGLPVVVAINRFANDTELELESLRAYCEARGAAVALSEAFAKGGQGAAALARKVVELIEAHPNTTLTTTYEARDPAIEKITKVAQKIYGADGVELSARAKENLARFTSWGYGELPVCVAKTQYSLSDDPKRLGAPRGWQLHVTDVALSAGAGFLVVISGAMMLMPGLPKASRALGIDVDENGEITGI
jgi:formate--tetrahydrofolate ligase